MSPEEAIWLVAAAFAAGAMNAVAGGGTVLTFPALIFFGMAPIEANATSTLALLLGVAGSVFGYRRHLPEILPVLPAFGAISVMGGLIGAITLTLTPEGLFGQLVPYLILFATLLFIGNNLFGQFFRLRESTGASKVLDGPHFLGALLFQLGVAIYGGYFGAGIGILMLASLGILGFANIHHANTLKTILAALINLVASIYFISADLIAWPQALTMTFGATVGYLAGSHFAQRIPQSLVRGIAAAIGLLISAILLLSQMEPAH